MKQSGSLGMIITAFILILSVSTVSFSDDYIINPSDILRTYIFDNPDININTTVPPDGIINFPLVGELNVLGLSANKLSKLLEQKLGYYIANPKVSVFVTAYNPLNVYFIGALRNPGSYGYKSGNRLTDYIADAGGFGLDADLKICYIYSHGENTPVKIINLKDILETPESSLNIPLQPFDTVYLKKKSGFLFSEWRDVADAMTIVVGVFTLYVIINKL